MMPDARVVAIWNPMPLVVAVVGWDEAACKHGRRDVTQPAPCPSHPSRFPPGVRTPSRGRACVRLQLWNRA